MPVDTKHSITKFPKFYYTDKEFEEALTKTVVVGEEEIKVDKLVDAIYKQGYTKASKVFNVPFNDITSYATKNDSLIQDYRMRKELIIAETIIDILMTGGFLTDAVKAVDESKHIIVSILLQHVSIEEACELIGEKEVTKFLSSFCGLDPVRSTALRIQEPVDKVIQYLSKTALERYKSHLILEKKVATFVGLLGLGMSPQDIATNTNENPKLVNRLLDKYTKGRIYYPNSISLFNRIHKLKKKGLSDEQIASSLGVKPNIVPMILEKKTS